MKKLNSTNNKSNPNTINNSNNSNQQKTLFQFWNKPKSNLENKITENFDLDKIIDLDLEQISNNDSQQYHNTDNEFKKPQKNFSSNKISNITTNEPCTSMSIVNNSTFDDADTDSCTVGLDEHSIKATQNFQCEGFDIDAGAIWIYPNNMPIRCYQYNIIEQCLHKNTMVLIMNFFHFNNIVCNKF
jgi:hypothetical protein